MNATWHRPARLGLVAAWLVGMTGAASGATLVAEDDTWRYFKGLSEASAPDATAWRQAGFDDSGWASGQGPFFYEFGAGYGGNTELPDMSGGYTCVFLRRTFDLANPAAIQTLTVDVRSDDGCIVWLNGREIGRVNMPDGEPTYAMSSLSASGEPNVASFEFANPVAILRTGGNVLAVQAFNASLSGSSDFLIGVALTSPVDVTPPRVLAVFPSGGAIVRELTQIEVVFDEAVTGVDAGDLSINGVRAASLEAFSPRDYLFRFPEPPEGRVEVAWAAGHGITDLAPVPNTFAGGSWSYTLDRAPRTANVVISEFLASNQSGVRDDFAERSDWIELLNLESEAVDLSGWFLTDDATKPAKWRFPGVTLPAGGYLLVWASERNLTNAAEPLHTNFKLSAGGEYLALLNPQTNVVSAFAPAYPPQTADVSYGRVPGDPEATGYFPTPTPGAANGDSGPGFAPAPVFSVAGGYFTNTPVVVTLSALTGVVRYTTNGTLPTEASTAATGRLEFTSSTVVHARVFQAGLLPGPVRVETYLVAGTGVTDFSSNLPVLVIHTSGRGIPQDSRIPVFVTAFGPFRGRTSLGLPPELMTKGQMEIRGQSSAGFPKKSYNLELNNPYGQDVEWPLLGLPEESDWVLYAPYTDKPLIHNFLAYELHRQMGHWSPRCRFVEVFIDRTGRLDYGSDYQGVYILMEKIKADNHRVDIARLTPYDTAEPAISGGYMIKKDKDSPGDRGFSTSGGGGFSGQYLKYHEPKPREITPAQQTWIRNYLNRFESALYAADWRSRTGANHYSAYIDVDSFVDNHWIVEFAKQIDGYRLSNYMYKDRGGKLYMSPIWDWNLSFGNADYLDGANTANWYYPQLADSDHIWLRRLIDGTTWSGGNAGDPDFNQRIADRWSELRTNVFAADRVIARIDELAAYLDEAQVREFRRWPRLGQYVWPNPPIYSTPSTYAGVVNAMKTWVRGRFNWIDRQYLAAPRMSRPGGGVSPGFTLTLTGSGGTVYYTTDGSDPRAPGGGLSPQAQAYSSEIVLSDTSRVVARVRSGSRWSGPTASTFVVNPTPLIITELMYHPWTDPGTARADARALEYIELKNVGQTPLDLRGFAFVGGVQFRFATGAVTSLDPGARVVVAADSLAFTRRYGTVPNMAGEFTGTLANEGERLTLQGPQQETVFSFKYDPTWQSATDGLGFALVAAQDASVGANLDSAGAWRVGAVRYGTPGLPEPAAPTILPVLVNEVLSHTDPPLVGSIELYNPNDQPADISNWFLTDDPLNPKFAIPAGTLIAPYGYRVFTTADFNPNPGVPPGFDLRASGDEAYLISADAAGTLTGYRHGFDFGASLQGVSFGRYVTSAGEEHFVAQASRSFGAANAGPKVGPVVISELMFHPPDVPANGALWDNSEDEYVEVANLASTNVALFDPQAPTNTWRLRDAVRYAFPTNQFIAAGERLLVVGFDPRTQPDLAAVFRSRYALPAGVRLFGPFDGKLANDHDSVELVQPDVVRFYGTNYVVTGVLVDKVEYRDAPPWPAGADGLGFSLQRLTETAYGNDPINWVAAAPTPGAVLTAAEPPAIVKQPEDRDVRPGQTASFEVQVAGGGPVQYQWRLDGQNLPGATAATLVVSGAQSTNAGVYEVIVRNAVRAIASEPARLRVGYPPEILHQPESVQGAAGGTAVFSVVAAGSSPLAYQWRKDGQAVPNAQGPSLTLTALQISDGGSYDVMVADESGTTTSLSASLTVLVPPLVTQSPVDQTVNRGETLTLSIAIGPGANLPLTFYWSFNGAVIATHTRSGYVDFLTIPAADSINGGEYRVRIANPALPDGIWSAPAHVQVVPWADADGDGMPDTFEQQFGLMPNRAADALEDADHDGVTNRDEYRAGTDPTQATSVLKLEIPSVGSSVVIRFQGQGNRTYSLLEAQNEPAETWRIVGAVPASSATPYQTRTIELTLAPALAGTARFYRVVTPGALEQ